MGNRASTSASIHSTDTGSTCSLASSKSPSLRRRSNKTKKTKSLKSIDSRIVHSNKKRYGAKDIDHALANNTNQSRAITKALQWVDAKNKQNMLKLYQVSQHDAVFHFPDTNVHLEMRPFWDSMLILFGAFPDLTFSYTSVREVEPGKVVFEDYWAEGHHTGGPLQFPPHPPVPPTGALVRDEPIRLTVTVKNDKVVDMVAETFGGLAGPPGFYAKALQAYEEKREKRKNKR